jgi:hypothetical protein
VATIARELGLRVDGVKGKLPQNVRPIGRARVALYKPWTENIDEGWTRWLFDQYEFSYITITDSDIRAGNLRGRFDAIILPNSSPDRLVSGYPPDAVPAEYSGGMTAGGLGRLRRSCEPGNAHLLVAVSDLAIAAFSADSRCRMRRMIDCSCPARFCDSMLILEAVGLNWSTRRLSAFSSAFEGSARGACERTWRRPVASAGMDTVALRGARFAAERLARRRRNHRRPRRCPQPAWGPVGYCWISVQHRGQSHATFRLLFNAIFTALNLGVRWVSDGCLTPSPPGCLSIRH